MNTSNPEFRFKAKAILDDILDGKQMQRVCMNGSFENCEPLEAFKELLEGWLPRVKPVARVCFLKWNDRGEPVAERPAAWTEEQFIADGWQKVVEDISKPA